MASHFVLLWERAWTRQNCCQQLVYSSSKVLLVYGTSFSLPQTSQKHIETQYATRQLLCLVESILVINSAVSCFPNMSIFIFISCCFTSMWARIMWQWFYQRWKEFWSISLSNINTRGNVSPVGSAWKFTEKPWHRLTPCNHSKACILVSWGKLSLVFKTQK